MLAITAEDYEAKEKLLKKLREDIEVALVYVTALQQQIKSIHESVSSEVELASFEGELKRKVRNVERVAKKGVTLKLVKEYRVVDDNV